MPSITFHSAIAKKLNNELKFDENQFIIGNIAPDCWRNAKIYGWHNRSLSHFQNNNLKFKNENYKIFFYKYHNKLNEPFYLGYLIHLITDTYYRKYISTNYITYIDRKKYYKLLDGTLYTGNRQELHEKKWTNIRSLDYLMKKHYRLHTLPKYEKVYQKIPQVEELDITGLNGTINFNNKLLRESIPQPSDMFKFEIVKLHLTECLNFIKKELQRLETEYQIDNQKNKTYTHVKRK